MDRSTYSANFIGVLRVQGRSTTFVSILLCIVLLVSSCQDTPTPRPRGELRLDLPSKKYVPMETNCPFTTVMPSYVYLDDAEKANGRCWKNMVFPDVKATIYLSYSPIDNNLPRLLKDSRDLTYDHHMKAIDIKSTSIMRPEDKVYGLIYEVIGDAASNTQFYLTDSTTHFLRGALYFNARPNWDSLAPAVEFVNEDIRHLIDELEWKQ